ncbi:MAG: cytochrome c biogenesis protein CcsA [Clostridia bacterium]|nr:cytochrome c biogenesis protein CcsA [Clostridia bacterium]
MPLAFLVLSYAAFQPMEIKELMPALRSTWFALHIGSAAFSYAAFAISGGLGVHYLLQMKKGHTEKESRMVQTDYMIYRLICLGFLLLTVVILSGAIWAEQAWSRWWSWDPKETWALITWILYAIFLHQRIRMKWQGKRMAWFAIIAVICVLFTFAGVNKLLPGCTPTQCKSGFTAEFILCLLPAAGKNLSGEDANCLRLFCCVSREKSVASFFCGDTSYIPAGEEE